MAHGIYGLDGLIVAGGVSAGIEKASKIMMPALAFILLFIVGYNAINGFAKGAEFLFKFTGSVCRKLAWAKC